MAPALIASVACWLLAGLAAAVVAAEASAAARSAARTGSDAAASGASIWPDSLPMCEQLLIGISRALGARLGPLAELKHHLQAAQFHRRRLLELELSLAEPVGQLEHATAGTDARRAEAELHRAQLQQHMAARDGITAHLQSLVAAGTAADAANGSNSTAATPGDNAAWDHAASLPTAAVSGGGALLRFLPQCLLARVEPGLHFRQRHHHSETQRPQDLHLRSHAAAAAAVSTAAAPQADAAAPPHIWPAAANEAALPDPRVPRSSVPAAANASSAAAAAARTPPPAPLVSLLVQYFNRPWMLPILAAPFRRCAGLPLQPESETTNSTLNGTTASNVQTHPSASNGTHGAGSAAGAGAHAPPGGEPFGGQAGGLGFGIEMLINVDSSADAAEVAAFAAGPYGTGFVVPVYSSNVHEIRSYNRLARLARGRILIMLQDDDVFPASTACLWLASVVRVFQRWPRMGAVGSQRYVFNYHPNTTDWGVHFWDAGAGVAPLPHLLPPPLGADAGAGAQGQGEQHGEQGQGQGQGEQEDVQQSTPGGVGRRRRRTLRSLAPGSRGGPTAGPGSQQQQQQRWRAEHARRLLLRSHAQRHTATAKPPMQWRRRRRRLHGEAAGPQEAAGGGGAGPTAGEQQEEGAGGEQGGEEEEQYEYVDAPEDPAAYYADGRLRMQFVSIIDYAPIAVRRSALLGVGGIDGNMSPSASCGVHSDYDFALRMWLAGWQVSFVEMPGLGKDPREGEGGTHRSGVAALCWERQWATAIAYMRGRWGQRNRWDPESYYWYGSDVFEVIAEHARLLNVRLLEPLAEPPGSYCPNGYGCGEAPVDNVTGTPARVDPPFGRLASWPKHLRAPWGAASAKGRGGARGGGAGGAQRRHGA